jgi:hypothetical protein
MQTSGTPQATKRMSRHPSLSRSSVIFNPQVLATWQEAGI